MNRKHSRQLSDVSDSLSDNLFEDSQEIRQKTRRYLKSRKQIEDSSVNIILISC